MAMKSAKLIEAIKAAGGESRECYKWGLTTDYKGTLNGHVASWSAHSRTGCVRNFRMSPPAGGSRESCRVRHRRSPSRFLTESAGRYATHGAYTVAVGADYRHGMKPTVRVLRDRRRVCWCKDKDALTVAEHVLSGDMPAAAYLDWLQEEKGCVLA